MSEITEEEQASNHHEWDPKAPFTLVSIVPIELFSDDDVAEAKKYFSKNGKTWQQLDDAAARNTDVSIEQVYLINIERMVNAFSSPEKKNEFYFLESIEYEIKIPLIIKIFVVRIDTSVVFVLITQLSKNSKIAASYQLTSEGLGVENLREIRRRLNVALIGESRKDPIEKYLPFIDNPKTWIKRNYAFTFFYLTNIQSFEKEKGFGQAINELMQPSINLRDCNQAYNYIEDDETKYKDLTIYHNWTTLVLIGNPGIGWEVFTNSYFKIIAFEVILQSLWNRCSVSRNTIEKIATNQLELEELNNNEFYFQSYTATKSPLFAISPTIRLSPENQEDIKVFKGLIGTSNIEEEIEELKSDLNILDKLINEEKRKNDNRFNQFVQWILIIFTILTTLIMLFNFADNLIFWRWQLIFIILITCYSITIFYIYLRKEIRIVFKEIEKLLKAIGRMVFKGVLQSLKTMAKPLQLLLRPSKHRQK